MSDVATRTPGLELSIRKRLSRWVARLRRRLGQPGVGRVDFGDLRRVRPISDEWGFDRGRPVDRYYIERFLSANAGDIRGHVLEVGTDMYTQRFGSERVSKSEVLHVAESNPKVTIVADLTDGRELPSDAFDCVILTGTLHVIFDVRAALGTLHRILRPMGVLLVTVPAISRISRYDADRWGDYWRFTAASMERLLEEAFPEGKVRVGAEGNVLAAAAFLYGIAAEELSDSELEANDPDLPILVSGRAQKAGVTG